MALTTSGAREKPARDQHQRIGDDDRFLPRLFWRREN